MCTRFRVESCASSTLQSVGPVPRENPWIFWPRLAAEIVYKHAILIHMIARLLLFRIAIAHDPNAQMYTDQALTPVRDDGEETLDLFTKTTGGHSASSYVKGVAKLTAAGQST